MHCFQNIDCDPNDPDDFVFLTASLWTSPRSYLIDELVALEDAGCRVEVAVAAATSMASNVSAALPQAQLLEHQHHKYFLVQARYAGSSERRRLLWTGSHNLTGTSLRSNDEALLRLEDEGLFDAFVADFETLGQ